ncbi:MAG: class F sortase [Thermoleophilaceae bacterium]|nr:class F sortase [Thermoleophilaceae bacterium]
MGATTRRLRPGLGLFLSIVVSGALAGGAAAWLRPDDRSIDLSPEPTEAQTPTVGSLLAALTLDPRSAGLRLPTASARPRRHAPAAAPGRRPGVPTRITITAAGSSGPVDRMGVSNGQLSVPPPGRAGWFAAGPRPGEIGRAVIVSHVDSKEGPALFYSLLQQGRGSSITVRDSRGATRRFAVVRRRQIEKSHFPRGSVYGPSRRRMLVLVTCGGPFSQDTGYRDNVILYARAI